MNDSMSCGLNLFAIAVFALLGLSVLFVILGILPYWFISKKAGLSPWLSLIMLVPLGALVLPYILAFIDWPALKKSDDARNLS